MLIKTSQAAELIRDILETFQVPYLVGSPGIGKSNIASQVAKSMNLKMVDVRLSQCDPADLNVA